MDAVSPKGEEEVIVHRASLLREIIAPLPKESLHSSKKLASIERNETGHRLVFEDGSQHHADVVIGADGVFSNVRDYVVAAEDGKEKKFAASPAGFWDARKMVPAAEAKAALGELYSADRQWCWFGDDAFILYDTMEDGDMVQCIISAIESNPSNDRKSTITKEFLDEAFKNWKRDSVSDALIKASRSLSPFKSASLADWRGNSSW